MATLLEVLIPAATAVIGTIFGRATERHKAKQDSRAAFLERVIQQVSANDFSYKQYVRSENHAQLIPYYDKAFLSELEEIYANDHPEKWIMVEEGSAMPANEWAAMHVRRVVARLRREWGFI